jgi:hypothetical protein
VKHVLSLSGMSLLAVAVLAGCQSPSRRPAPIGNAALPVMERVALSANACWFKSKDPAFAAYKLAPELNSFSGTPRILLVHAHSPESRPLAVIQAEGNPARLSAFGPLLAEPVGQRISSDATRWARGMKGC